MVKKDSYSDSLVQRKKTDVEPITRNPEDEKSNDIIDNRNLPVSLQRGKSNHKWLAMLTVVGALVIKLLQDYNSKKGNKSTLYTPNHAGFLNYAFNNSVLKDYYTANLTNFHYEFELVEEDPIQTAIKGSEFLKYDIESVFLKDWEDYYANGFGYDVYKPLTKQGKNIADDLFRLKSNEKSYLKKHGHSLPMGNMIISSLDTMLLMYNNTVSLNNNLKFKYHIDKCLHFIEKNISFEKFDYDNVSVFETTSNILGGLLSSYSLIQSEPFLKDAFPDSITLLETHALELGSRLLKAFEHPNGSFNPVPLTNINLATGKKSFNKVFESFSHISDITSLQLEFKYLESIAAKGVFPSSLYQDIEKPFDIIEHNLAAQNKYDSLIPELILPNNYEIYGDSVAITNLTVSYYESLIKQYHYNNDDQQFQVLFWNKVDKIKKYLVKKTDALSLPKQMLNKKKSGKWKSLTYLAQLPVGVKSPSVYSSKFEQKSCVLPASILLGVSKGFDIEYIKQNKCEFDDVPDLRQNYDLALELIRSCYHMYIETEQTHISPASVVFNDKKAIEFNNSFEISWKKSKYNGFFIPHTEEYNVQGSETIESIYYAYKVSKSKTFQIWNFEIFKNFVINSQGKCLKSAVTGKINDQMESYWFSKTLKYFYLTFLDDDEGFDLTQVVFNSNGHTFPVKRH
ncbi:hypothetical protein QEN19_002589 [Hanseniaspora menglaensis]